MKKILIILVVIAIAALGGYFLYKNQNSSEVAKAPEKVLVAYFSHSGNTRAIAEMIAQKTGGDLFEIKPEQGHYPDQENAFMQFADNEKRQNLRPKLMNKVEDFNQYDKIFIGYPNWFNDMPMIVYTFLESYDFSNKKVYHFCTHGTTGPVREDGFAIFGKTVQEDKAQADAKVSDWLKSLK